MFYFSVTTITPLAMILSIKWQNELGCKVFPVFELCTIYSLSCSHNSSFDSWIECVSVNILQMALQYVRREMNPAIFSSVKCICSEPSINKLYLLKNIHTVTLLMDIYLQFTARFFTSRFAEYYVLYPAYRRQK